MIMKRKRISETESLVAKFVDRHCRGDLLRRVMDMSPSFEEDDMRLLQKLSSKDSSRRLNECKETVDIILDAKSSTKSFRECIEILESYSKDHTCLSKENVAVVTPNLCVEALKNSRLLSRGQHSMLLNVNAYVELTHLTRVIKELAANNKFKINIFRNKYVQMENLMLELLLYFHKSDIVMFTTYLHHNSSKSQVMDHMKHSMVELLCCVSGVALSSAANCGDMSSLAQEQKIDATSANNCQERVAKTDVTVDGEMLLKTLLEFKQDMAKELISLLLCVANIPGPDDDEMKAIAEECNDIIEDVTKRAMETILSVSLNTTEEVKLSKNPKNYLSLLLDEPPLTSELLEPFLTQHLVSTLTYKPDVDIKDAVSKQTDWLYSRSPSVLISVIKSMLVGLQTDSLEVLKDLLKEENVNWRLLLICVSVYLHSMPEGGKELKSLVDWLLNKAFLSRSTYLLSATFLIARQCCAEGCAPWFTSYMSWFGSTFGPESSWATRTSATQQTFEFFMNFLTNLVPYEPSLCLKVHINKAPASPPNSFCLLGDYVTLAKTRLMDLNEAPGFGIFGPESNTEQDIEFALKYFETHNGEVAQILLDASVFRRQHFEQEFVGKLLTPRVLPDIPDTRARFIGKLHSMGKISHSTFNRYQEACLSEARVIQDALFSNSPTMIMDAIDPRQKLEESLEQILESLKTMNQQWDSQRGDISSWKEGLVRVVHCLKDVVGEAEKKSSLERNRPIASVQIMSGDMGTDTGHWVQTVEMLIDTFIDCYSSVSQMLNLIWPAHFVDVFQPFRNLKIVLFRKIFQSCIQELPMAKAKIKSIAALVHSIECTGSNIFPEIVEDEQMSSFASFLSEHLPLTNAWEMEECYRFAMEYMSYAEAYHQSLKMSANTHMAALSSNDNQNGTQASSEEISTVPLSLVKKYLYLHNRYSLAYGYEINGIEKYSPDATNPHLWNSILSQAEMSVEDWFKHEANIKPFEDFLVSRHEYLLNRLTNRSIFDPSNISGLASEILHIVYTMDWDINKDDSASLLTVHSWQNFHRDMMKVLTSLLETYPIEPPAKSLPWLLHEWLTLRDKSDVVSDISFFRIASSLPPWLMFSNLCYSDPSEHTIQILARLVNSRLKDVLSDYNGFLNQGLLHYLLIGLSITQKSASIDRARRLFSVLFESCPSLTIAIRVHSSTAVPILRRFTATDMAESSTQSSLTHLIATFKPVCPVEDWEVGLDVWLQHQSAVSIQPSAKKWVFFYRILELGSHVQSGIVKFKISPQAVSFEYLRDDIAQSNIVEVLLSEVENDSSVLETLDIAVWQDQLPFCGLSTVSQNMMCLTTVLLILLYNSLTETHTNKFMTCESSASLVCRVLLSCYAAYMNAPLPPQRAQEAPFHSTASQKTPRTCPILDTELLLVVKKRLYSILATVTSRQAVTIPQSYITSTKDPKIRDIF
ncbi:uncharacterized protein [Periplaneta americana]|uniref:uncharacterized protein isoform X2 n=1 Tax=Periplaneta americana TaxID=6978 RepID=UPI0037E84D57